MRESLPLQTVAKSNQLARRPHLSWKLRSSILHTCQNLAVPLSGLNMLAYQKAVAWYCWICWMILRMQVTDVERNGVCPIDAVIQSPRVTNQHSHSQNQGSSQQVAGCFAQQTFAHCLSPVTYELKIENMKKKNICKQCPGATKVPLYKWSTHSFHLPSKFNAYRVSRYLIMFFVCA